jgi:predicted acyl esterase
MLKNLLGIALMLFVCAANAQNTGDEKFIRENYSKSEYDIQVRDGVKLHTIVYVAQGCFR